MKALIIGITGQDGSYLSELLLEKGYEVYGIVRRSSSINTPRLDHLLNPDQIHLVYGDLEEGVEKILLEIEPRLIFNLGAMSHVRVSFDIPTYTMNVNAIGPLRILEAMRKLDSRTRFYQASSSEMFGSSPAPQNENTPFQPCSPYGISKLSAYWTTRLYREAYGLFAANGILFNHESPRRGETFVTKKIVRAAVRIKLGLQDKLVLGNIDALRDWGHSREYMEAVYRIITHNEPDDFVVATNDYYSVRYFLCMVFDYLGLQADKYVQFDPIYLRPKEVPELRGDPSKIKRILGWEATISIWDLMKEMVDCVMQEEKEKQHV